MPNGSVQPEAWHDHSAQNKAEAEREMAKSQRLRENIFHAIEQPTNDLKVQIDATNFEFRKRIYEMRRAKEELEYQMRKVYSFENVYALFNEIIFNSMLNFGYFFLKIFLILRKEFLCIFVSLILEKFFFPLIIFAAPQSR